MGCERFGNDMERTSQLRRALCMLDTDYKVALCLVMISFANGRCWLRSLFAPRHDRLEIHSA